MKKIKKILDIHFVYKNPETIVVENDFYEGLMIFQNIKMKNEDQLKTDQDAEMWREIQNKYKNFYNTIVEFNGENSLKEKEKCFCMIGKKIWE